MRGCLAPERVRFAMRAFFLETLARDGVLQMDVRRMLQNVINPRDGKPYMGYFDTTPRLQIEWFIVHGSEWLVGGWCVSCASIAPLPS